MDFDPTFLSGLEVGLKICPVKTSTLLHKILTTGEPGSLAGWRANSARTRYSLHACAVHDKTTCSAYLVFAERRQGRDSLSIVLLSSTTHYHRLLKACQYHSLNALLNFA